MGPRSFYKAQHTEVSDCFPAVLLKASPRWTGRMLAACFQLFLQTSSATQYSSMEGPCLPESGLPLNLGLGFSRAEG